MKKVQRYFLDYEFVKNNKILGSKNKNLLNNDVIIQVSSEKIIDISSFQSMIANSIKLNRDKLLLRVIRDGNEFWLINPFVIE